MFSLTSRGKQKRQGLALIRTVKATGLSRATVMQIKREQRRLPEGIEFSSPAKRYCRTRKRVITVTPCLLSPAQVRSCMAQKCPLVSDVTMSCDCHMVIPHDIASIVVALVSMYGELWLA